MPAKKHIHTLPKLAGISRKGVIAITRAVSPALADCNLTFVEREPIDFVKASEQHAGYCTALKQAGLSVFTLSADERLPDAVFVEDTAVVLEELAIVARPAAANRRREVDAIAAALARHRRVERINSPGTLEGGDVLRIRRQLFVGRSIRTNDSGFMQFAAITARLGYEASQVDVDGCLHLKTAVTALSEAAVLINPSWVDSGNFKRFHQVTVAEDEPFAANTLALNGLVHISAKWERTRRILEAEGFATASLPISELEKAEAGLTCLSLIFRNTDS